MVKKGMVLIVVLGVLAVLVVASSAVIRATNGEIQMVKVQNNSIRAFYLAEAGLEHAMYRLKKGDNDDFQGALYSAENDYSVNLQGASPLYTIISTGAYPSLTAQDKAARKVEADVTVQPNGHPESVVNAIETNGSIRTSGAVTINGTTEEESALDFQSIFDITKEQMEAAADNLYLDPPNNKMPVEKITWVNLTSSAQFRISQTGWSGGGILVVKEAEGATSPALEIEGGTFNGVIWVIGNLRISGNAIINGAIFVENGSAEVSKLTGTPVITYDQSVVSDAFGYLGNSIIDISNWQEVL